MEQILNQLFQPILEAISSMHELTISLMTCCVIITLIVFITLIMVTILAVRMNKFESKINELLKK